jgi:hypothetical protein
MLFLPPFTWLLVFFLDRDFIGVAEESCGVVFEWLVRCIGLVCITPQSPFVVYPTHGIILVTQCDCSRAE